MDLAELLQHNYLMKGLGQAEVAKVAKLATIKEYSGGDTLVRQFDKKSDLMIVLEGAIRVNSYSGEKIAEGGPGCIIGEISLLDDKPRSATVTSVGKTKVAVIPSESLWSLMNEDSDVAKRILLNLGQVLCMRIRGANLQLDTVIGKDFAARR